MLKGKTFTQRIITSAMKNIELLGWSIVACVVLFFLTLILIQNAILPSWGALFLGGIMLLGVGLYAVYQPASRFRELLDALRPNVLDVEWIYNYTLKISTSNLGEFFLKYHPEREDASGYYIIWITSDKSIPVMGAPSLTLWSKPYKPILRDWHYFPSPPYVPTAKANEIKTLKWIIMDWSGTEFRIMAWLSDEWLQSETDDLMKTVEILEEIYARM